MVLLALLSGTIWLGFCTVGRDICVEYFAKCNLCNFSNANVGGATVQIIMGVTLDMIVDILVR